MCDGTVDLERLTKFIRLVEQHGLGKLVVEEKGCRYEVVGTGESGTVDIADVDAIIEAPELAEEDGSRIAIASPMVGVFFRAAAPNEPPYVEVGDWVEAGQTIGVIEAMKVFSEVPAPHSGIVDEIVVEDRSLVKAGQVLMYLRSPSDEEEILAEQD